MQIVGGGSDLHVKLDGIYTLDSDKNTQVYNDSGLVIRNLAERDVVHAVHLDTNLIVNNSAAGTVLVGMMIQSVLTVNSGDGSRSGSKVACRGESAAPPLGFLTFIALSQPHDIIVNDDQTAVVLTDLYEEQQPGHLVLSGSSSSTRNAGKAHGRVTIQGVKSELTSPQFATIDDYEGSLFVMGTFFMEKSFPEWQINQTGSREFNLTMLGNNFDSEESQSPLGVYMTHPDKLNLVANTRSNFSDIGLGADLSAMEDVVNDPSNWLVHEALDDFRRLGLADLRLNHPQLPQPMA